MLNERGGRDGLRHSETKVSSKLHASTDFLECQKPKQIRGEATNEESSCLVILLILRTLLPQACSAKFQSFSLICWMNQT